MEQQTSQFILFTIAAFAIIVIAAVIYSEKHGKN